MKNIIYIILFCASVLSAQNNFFKYSTFYTSMSTGTSYIEDQDYIAVDKGYDEVTDVMKEMDLDLKHPLVNSIELRKLTK